MTEQLHARTSFIIGFARIFDFSGALSKHYNKAGFEADMRAIESDWQQVGNDIRIAAKKVVAREPKLKYKVR